MTLNLKMPTAAGLVAVATLGLWASAAGAAPNEAGIWYDDTGKGAVRIEQCGEKLCGRIHWLKEPLNAEGKPLRDKHNPNASQQNRPICGLQVIGGLAPMQDGEWDTGWIYDPKEGKSYSVAMKLADQNTLKVTGYLVMKLMGRTLTWTRAPSDLPACAESAAAVQPGAEKVSAPKATPPPSKVAAPLPAEDDPRVETPAKSTELPAAAPATSIKKTKKAAAQAPTPGEADPDVSSKPEADKAESAGAETAPAAQKAPAKAKAVTAPAQADPNAAGKSTAVAAPAKTDKKKAAAKSGSKSKEPEQLPWAPKKDTPVPAAAEVQQPDMTASAPVAMKPRPAAEDVQARPFQ